MVAGILAKKDTVNVQIPAGAGTSVSNPHSAQPSKTVGTASDSYGDKKPEFERAPITIIVQDGETLQTIAAKYGTTVAEIKANNEIGGKNNDYILAGKTKLTIMALTEKGKAQKAKYERELAAKDEKELKEYEAQLKREKAEAAQAKKEAIGRAQTTKERINADENLKNKYTVEIDKETGIAQITVKDTGKKISLKEMKEDLNLAPGSFKKDPDLYNNKMDNPFWNNFVGNLDYNTAKPGATFNLPVESFLDAK